MRGALSADEEPHMRGHEEYAWLCHGGPMPRVRWEKAREESEYRRIRA
jgi:hypothetical protein